MKIRKIAAQCKARGAAILWDQVDGDGCANQWISNGCAAWPVNGVPLLTAKHLPALFELTGKQAEEMNIMQTAAPQGVDFSDYSNGDVMARESGLRITAGGVEMMPLTAHGVTMFIDTAHLAPVWAEYDVDQLIYCLRKDGADGTEYVAVFAGWLLVGLVWPMGETRRLAEQLGALAQGTPGPETE